MADQAKNATGAAQNKLATLADVYYSLGKTDLALSTAERAHIDTQNTGVLYRIALLYIRAGRIAKAEQIASTLSKKLEKEPQVHGKLIEAEILLNANRSPQAIQKVEEAQRLIDTWLGRFALGRAYLQAGEFTHASIQLDKCWERRGEATAVFLDDLPSYHRIVPLYYYLGRAQEGLNSPRAAEQYRSFLATNKNDKDPLIRDARQRVAMLEKASVR